MPLHHPPGPVANERVQTNAAGQVVLKLKAPWRDGTTHLVMSPLEFMPLPIELPLWTTAPARISAGCASRVTAANWWSFSKAGRRTVGGEGDAEITPGVILEACEHLLCA